MINIIKTFVLKNGESDTISPPAGTRIVSAMFRARPPCTPVWIGFDVDGGKIQDAASSGAILFPAMHWFGLSDGFTLSDIKANKIGIRARDKGAARDQGQPPTDRIELDVCCLCEVIK